MTVFDLCQCVIKRVDQPVDVVRLERKRRAQLQYVTERSCHRSQHMPIAQFLDHVERQRLVGCL